MDKKQDQWHVDRGIPIAWIITMAFYAVVNAAVGGWYVSQTNSRLSAVEANQTSTASLPERVARMEEKLVSVQGGVNRIEAALTAVRATRPN